MATALQLSDVDLLLVTEPWWGAIGDDNMGEVRQPGYTTLLPVQSVISLKLRPSPGWF